MTNHPTIIAPLLLIALITLCAAAHPDDSPAPTNLGPTWTNIDNQTYGAQPNELGPIGGGPGYQRILTDGHHRVADLDQLLTALKTAQPGQTIYLEPHTEVDCTTRVFTEKLVLKIPANVTLAGNRGHQNAPGPIISSDAFATNPLIEILGPNVRITGLRLRGPDPKRRIDHGDRAFNPDRGDRAQQSEYYYRLPVATGITTKHPALEVDNCELSGWSAIAIALAAGPDHHIHHNYIHHNQRHHLGYGVGHDQDAVSLIECNLFNYNRHSIAASGAPDIGYEARHNLEIQHALNHCFDMHGGIDRRDGTNVAGQWMKIHHNTFRPTDVPAVMIRGVPSQSAHIHHNWFHHPSPQGVVVCSSSQTDSSRVNCSNNAYGPTNPAVLDVQYPDWITAFSAAQSAYQRHNYAEARAKSVQALALAHDPAQTAVAHLYIGRCYQQQNFIPAARHQYQTVLNSPDTPPQQHSTAQHLLQQAPPAPATSPPRPWTLAFTDDFDRPQLGPNYRIIQGTWQIQAGQLHCTQYPAQITIQKPFPGLHRLEFDVITHTQTPSDLSPVIQSGSTGFESGYLLQFGGYANTINRILRQGAILPGPSVDHRFIQTNQTHHVTAQFDGSTVQLSVDGQIMAQAPDHPGLIGPNHQTIGLYLFCPAQIDNLQVHTAHPD